MYITYAEKLKSPEWIERKNKILARDLYRCQNCGKNNRILEVHHLDYLGDNEPWEYPDDMLLALCYECHRKERGREDLEKNLATSFKMQGFLCDDLLALSSAIDLDRDFRKYLLTYITRFKDAKKGCFLLPA